ncbi:hypothetical protein CGSHi22421_00125 [Haemophilus influenzae R3021]|uniref:Enoyl reductase (ER) domain-containing protein n=1 Tax=Haemophilus influenzae R3021 TaxID=375432 RepID=A4N4S2_HAEIF|nr:hypothetical protein CGSHi22421_00125 [Haemophilus influenzae R3021]
MTAIAIGALNAAPAPLANTAGIIPATIAMVVIKIGRTRSEYGTYGEIVNMPVHAVVKHPENLTMEQAAASWMMFVTAYGGLIEFGKVQKGDFVVLGGATSSVGIAAIQIAKMQGANVIALSRTHAKGDVLLQKGADFVIATKEDDVTAKLLEITNGKGVNLVFDPLGDKEAAKNYQRNDTRRQIHHLRCIKPR